MSQPSETGDRARPLSHPAIRIDNLSFGYPGQPELFDHFDLEIPAGSRFGLFGPNGAGKTTLMHLMTGLLKASAGSIRLFGEVLNSMTGGPLVILVLSHRTLPSTRT
jgi:ABC-type multidrug transport system ATPase subunit